MSDAILLLSSIAAMVYTPPYRIVACRGLREPRGSTHSQNAATEVEAKKKFQGGVWF